MSAATPHSSQTAQNNRASQTTHREVEVKLDAEASFALPDLSALPGVTRIEIGPAQELEAVYLDSADLRLARHGTTFRRRTGGDDAGWHLKLPAAGAHERLEIRRAPGRSVRAVPAQLVGLVRVQLRGDSVEPVARIATHRTVHRLIGDDGVVLAEVADDRVTGEALGESLVTTTWREIEVELVEGDTALLDAAGELLLTAGATPASASSKLRRALAHRLEAYRLEHEAGVLPKTTARKKSRKKVEPAAGEVAVRYLAEQVAELVAQDPQVRLKAEEGVHQMRVATRRLRTALATFRPLFTDGAVDPLREELKWIGGVLGQARDAEVMKGHLHHDLAGQPRELVIGPVLRRVDLELNQAFKEAYAHILEALDGERYLSLVNRLEAFVARPPFSERASAPAAEELRARVAKTCKRVRQAEALLVPGQSAEERDHQLHQVRIAAKRARYAAEAVEPVAGKAAKKVVSSMKAIQETLGDHQDAVVEREWLRDLGVRAFLNGENAFTFGRLHGLTEARALHDETRFESAWAAARTAIVKWPGL